MLGVATGNIMHHFQ